jgi:tRNA A37 threonylcarbamoyladenosine biosynthesis protein TsaE
VALVDRLTEMGVMRGLVAGARESSSGVLVLRGQAGMGKTALLRETADHAASVGMRVARAAARRT